ncbi:MAG TPA: hypothetical protein VGL65_01630 [Gemmatimonadales bacterium]|jgi:hypothetical protein
MRRSLMPLVLAAALTVAGCRDYDRYGYVSSEKGLISPDEYARYGPDQAIAMAIGREFGKAYAGRSAADFGKQADAAIAYSKKYPQVANVASDSLGYRLVVTFADGWATQVTPITDGKNGDQTANLPKGK